MDLLENLNSSQLEAVKSITGPVMVMAGAGSGKTKVLTTRIAYLIKEVGILPDSILAVTFTNKAAGEMKERIEKMTGEDTKWMWVSTFHSFCSRLLRLEIGAMAPYTKYFTILDDEDSLKIVKDIMKENEYDDFKPKEIRNLISKAKNFPEFKIKDPNLNDTYDLVSEEYESYCRKNNLLDFDDLIIKAIELFKNNPDILKKYQKKFEYILVDEFQDTNTLQYDLMFMLSARHHNIFVVGDDFQSIYSFRGAKIENINRFRRDFIEHKLILLEQNYRSTTQILDLANCVITKNSNQIKKTMFSNNSSGQKPFFYQADSAYDEAMFVIDKIKELKVCGDNYKDFAILYRANYVSRQFEEMLMRYQIPYRIYGGISFFDRKEVKDIIAYLRLLVNKNDNFAFKRIINEPRRKIGPSLIEKLELQANELNKNLYDTIPYYTGKGQGASAMFEFKKIIDDISALIDTVPFPNLVDMVFTETGYEKMLGEDEDTYQDRKNNVLELKSYIKESEDYYEGTNPEKLAAILSDLTLKTDHDDDEFENDDCVRLTTYHQAKGLEFKNVFMVATEEEIFPSINCITPSEIEEERRICYVGITRAKKKLYITSAYSRYLFGCQRYLSISRFVKEMDKDLFKSISGRYESFGEAKPKKDSIVNVEPKKEEGKAQVNEFKVGDKLNHKLFGDGVVVSTSGNIITVAFSLPHGVKKLVATHPSIRKI